DEVAFRPAATSAFLRFIFPFGGCACPRARKRTLARRFDYRMGISLAEFRDCFRDRGLRAPQGGAVFPPPRRGDFRADRGGYPCPRGGGAATPRSAGQACGD